MVLNKPESIKLSTFLIKTQRREGFRKAVLGLRGEGFQGARGSKLVGEAGEASFESAKGFLRCESGGVKREAVGSRRSLLGKTGAL
jgi:hypothetical protein